MYFHLRQVLGVAVMMSRPNDPFLKKWIAEIDRSFDPTCYACHSILLGSFLLRNIYWSIYMSCNSHFKFLLFSH